MIKYKYIHAGKIDLSKFKNIVFLGSQQDKYSPLESSLLRPAESLYFFIVIYKINNFLLDMNEYLLDMSSSVWSNLEKSGTHVVSIDVSFGASVASGLDHLIGKAAHVTLLSSDSFLRLLTLTIKPYFVI